MQPINSASKEGWFKRRGVIFLKRQVYSLFLMILLITSSLFAQPKTDSLRKLLWEARGINRAEILLELAEHTRQNNIEKAIYQVKEALSIADRRREEELQSEGFQQIGWYYSIIDQDTTALTYFLKSLKIERQHGHRLEQASVLHQLGRFYDGQDNNAKALNNFFHAVRIRQEENDKRGASTTLYYIGGLYYERSKYKMTAWAKNYWEALHPHSAGGVYLNFTMKEKEKRIKASLGKNYERLQKIKAKYDPDNMFRVNQNIKPTNGQANS